MIEYDTDNRVVTMDLVDLEHCGFDWREFKDELKLAGIDDMAAEWPVALLVDFVGGSVVTPRLWDRPEIPEALVKVLTRRDDASERFEVLRARMLWPEEEMEL